MWYFIVIALSIFGDRTPLQEAYAFQSRESCVQIQRFVEDNLVDIGPFEVTPCKFTPFNDRLEVGGNF